MKRTMIEEQEGFGAPPDNERLEAAAELLMSSGVWLSPDAALPAVFKEAEAVMGERYTDALDAWLGEMNVDAHSLPDLFPPPARRFFHAAAALGEARMLRKLAEKRVSLAATVAEMA